MDVPTIRYARTADGLNIAYQVVGEGPFDLVHEFAPRAVLAALSLCASAVPRTEVKN